MATTDTATTLPTDRSGRINPDEIQNAACRLRVLAVEVDDRLPRRLALLDQLILAGDREIARLRRALAAGEPAPTADRLVAARQPDAVILELHEDAAILPLNQPSTREPRRRAA
jgi:hypothetical protein